MIRVLIADDHGIVRSGLTLLIDRQADMQVTAEAQVRGFEERSGIRAQLQASGDPSLLDEEKQTVIYRVAQEALANAGRHAHARSVALALDVIGEAVELRIRDDGVGFDPVACHGDGLGLGGMAERARLVGGDLDLRSSPGSGTELTLRVP